MFFARAVTAGMVLSLLTVISLGGCASDSRYARLAPAPPSYGQIPDINDQFSYAALRNDPQALNGITPALGAGRGDVAPQQEQRASFSAALRSSCDIKDRFDRDLTLSYRFADGRTRIGLDVDADVMAARVDGIKFAFRYKLQKPGKKERADCLYESPVQGLVGSAYNELFLREKDTVWNALEERGL